tara:strand:+ start:360 stop:515 length:156 start_codon:yes stop_codon:yes gene_type:complete
MKNKELLKVSRFAELERVKRDTIYKRIKNGDLKTVNVGGVIFVDSKYLAIK